MKRRNRKLRKALLMTCCALALVAISVGATLAYLTDTEGVTNVFTVGKVDISLDEAPVDANGEATTGTRVTENNYHLIPGKTYDKDPTVHVVADSENSWIFVKVENDLADIEGSTTIADQIEDNGWMKLDDVDNVYYQSHTKQSTAKDYVVFEYFTIDGSDVDNAELAEYANASIKVTAYAIQMAGFENDAASAWDAGQNNWTVYPAPTVPAEGEETNP